MSLGGVDNLDVEGKELSRLGSLDANEDYLKEGKHNIESRDQS